jgi:AraC-like DNA-binding protein
MLGRTGKQFLRYYIIFFLCLVVLFVPLYQINLSMVSRSYLNAAGNMLKTGLANLETDLGNLDASARVIYNNPKFRRLSYIQEPEIADYYHAISVVDDFKSFFASAGIIADCGIIYGNNMILTTKRLYFPWEQFYGDYFMRIGSPTADQWIAEMPKEYFTSAFIPLSGFSTLEGSYEAITFCTSFADFPGKRAFFFATLEKNYILSRLATDTVLQKGRILIRETGGTLLIDSGGWMGKEAGGSDAVTLEMSGQKRGIRVRVDIPRKMFREQLVPFQRLAFIFALAYLSLGIALSIYFAQRSAEPIREIVEDVLSFGDRGGLVSRAGSSRTESSSAESRAFSLADFQNDYTYIRHFLSKAERDLETFNVRLAQQEELQRENLFERLLYGLVYSAAWQTVKDYFPGFPEIFRIAAVALPDMEEAALSAYTMRQAMIQDIIEPHLPSGAYAHFSGNLLVLFLPEDAPDSPLLRLRALTADLRVKLNARCRTALSETERDSRDIHRAFYLVRHLLRLPAREGDEDILQKGNSDLFSFPLELLDASRLYEMLLHGEEEKAVDFINNMFYELCRQGYTREDDIQQIFFIYRRVLLQIAGDLELGLSEGIIPAYDSQPELSFLFARVAKAVRKICGIINARRAEKDNGFERPLIDYIDENITNPGLYIKMVTGFFHISENRLQAIMRKWTGKSFLEYVESKRMVLSRELLLMTPKSISQITRECGYSSENSFYKAFRRFYGQSPSELRG